MTASTVKYTKVTALLDSSPKVLQDVRGLDGHLRIYADTTEVPTTSTDEIGDVTLMCPVPSDLVVHSLVVFNDDLDSGTALAADVGLYNGPKGFGTKAAYAVLDADAFASAITDLQG